MGELIRFPQERRTAAAEDYRAEAATILILPSVRIEYETIIGPEAEQRTRTAFAALCEAFAAQRRGVLTF
jgi:hypothetical protein